MNPCSDQISNRPFSYPQTYLFLTPQGYVLGNSYTDGNVTPRRIHSQPIFLNPSSNRSEKYLGEGYLCIGDQIFEKSLSPTAPVSGVNGTIQETRTSSRDLSISQPLTLHDSLHKDLLDQAQIEIHTYIQDYLQAKDTSVETLSQLLNMILYIDDFPSIPSHIIQETLHNFLSDYIQFSETTWLRSPFNYLLDPLRIDGLCFGNECISFQPAYSLDLECSN